MVKVENNKITMTRGDSLILKLNLISNKGKRNANGAPYEKYVVQENDVIRFAMSRGYVGEKNYKLFLEKIIYKPGSIYTVDNICLILDPDDTKYGNSEDLEEKIPLGVYNYDIQLTHEDGRVDTVISSTIQLLGECE